MGVYGLLFFLFLCENIYCDSHWNCLSKQVQVNTQNLWFCEEMKIYKYSLTEKSVLSRFILEERNIHRVSYTSGHFIWNLWNDPKAGFINFIWNELKCKILFIIWHIKLDFIAFKVDNCSAENTWLTWMLSWRNLFPPKCYVTCGHTIFMTWHSPLNNRDVIG